jgi:hypothetical protein
MEFLEHLKLAVERDCTVGLVYNGTLRNGRKVWWDDWQEAFVVESSKGLQYIPYYPMAVTFDEIWEASEK